MLPAEYAFELFSLVVRRRKGYITETGRTCCHVKGVGQWTAEKGRRGGDLAKRGIFPTSALEIFVRARTIPSVLNRRWRRNGSTIDNPILQ